jgi:tartrate dehydratase beta subunit/fumarate hydratase class I family protein
MDREIMKAIRYAHEKNIIMIAAAKSDTEGQLTFPARAREVMAIYPTDHYGRISAFSPMLAADGPKFATVGENIRVPFLREGCVSGASVAATIAGGLAALVLEFAAQHSEEVPEAIWSQMGMTKVFQLMATKTDSLLFYLVPWRLLSADKSLEEILAMIRIALME